MWEKFDSGKWTQVMAKGAFEEEDALFVIRHFENALQSVGAIEEPWDAYCQLMRDVNGVNMASQIIAARWPLRWPDIGERLRRWVDSVRDTTATVARRLGPGVIGFSIGVGFPGGVSVSIIFSVEVQLDRTAIGYH